MKDLLDLILKHITTHPDDIVITESDDQGITLYTIQVNPEDMGRVIGKDGKVIRAIRSLAHVIAVRQGKRFRIKLADEEGHDSAEIVEATADETEKPAEVKEVIDTKSAKEETDLIAGAIDVSKDAEEK
jgi:uncharacterized protein